MYICLIAKQTKNEVVFNLHRTLIVRLSISAPALLLALQLYTPLCWKVACGIVSTDILD